MPATAEPEAEGQTVACEEDLLLSRHAAERLLEACDVIFSRVVRVCDDGAILYIREGRVGSEFPLTAWTETGEDGRTRVRVENGWPAVRASNLLLRASKSDIHEHGNTEQHSDDTE